jgi:hypothetical protein
MFAPMPRKSSADLKIVRLPGGGRPEPPAQLDAAEAKIWRAVVGASPDGFLDGAAQLILRQVVCQIAVADRQAERLRALAALPKDEVDAEMAVAKAHREALASIIRA